MSTENIFLTRTAEAPLFFADSSLESKTAGACDLFMILEQNAIQLALKERRSGNLLAYEVIHASDRKQKSWKYLLEDITTHSKVLRNYEFLKVTAGIMSPEFTLVPESLFKPGNETIYFTKNFPAVQGMNIRTHHITAQHLYTVFGINLELEQEVNHLFQDPQFWHYSQALLTGMAMKMKTESGKQFWLNVRSDKIDIVVSENKKLLLMNSFSWLTNEDVLYFTLFVCEQLDLNPEIFPLTVTGEIETGSALYKLLFKYIRNIIIPEKPSSLSFALETEEVPFHHYAMLYNLALCE